MHETAVDMQKVKHETVVWKILEKNIKPLACVLMFFSGQHLSLLITDGLIYVLVKVQDVFWAVFSASRH